MGLDFSVTCATLLAMKMAATFTLVATFFANTVLADCPAPPDHSKALEGLVSEANAAATEQEGREISSRMWELWVDAPDARAKAVLDRGMARRESYDFAGAVIEFDKLVAYCPDYAEGYNQRAFARFLQGDFATALGDLERAIELSPGHVAAISGLALTLMQLDRTDEARVMLKKALDLNPWLGERHLMATGGPLAIPGEDI